MFEGITKNSLVDHVVPHFDTESSNPRMQLESTTVRNEYSKKYEEQLRHIIEGYTIMEGEEDSLSAPLWQIV